MSTPAQRNMTVDEFLAWAEGQEGRWELYNGVPCRMPSQQIGHIGVKAAVYFALRQSILRAAAPCHAAGDGAGCASPGMSSNLQCGYNTHAWWYRIC